MQQHSDSRDGDSCDRSDWRREEHGRFMQALELYGSRQTGDEWKHITDFVGSRTMEEVRLHGRQYLQRLVQQLPPSPTVARYLLHAGSPNDSNRRNYHGIDSHKSREEDRGKRVAPQSGALVSSGSALSAAALDCALSMNVFTPIRFRSQPRQLLQQENPTANAAPHRNGRWTNSWTFQEEKAFETALVGWAGSKSYPWTQIAAAVPGRTAKEVCNRFDEMVGEIASIEAGEIPALESSTLSSSPKVGRQHGRSSLSQRAVPPPPIEVRRRDGPAGVFLSGTSTRSCRGSFSGIPMLSPTFLDMLANEADSEEKSSLPALLQQFPEVTTSLPSPLFSSIVLPAASPTSFFSPGAKKSAAQGKKRLSSANSNDIKMEDMDTSIPTVARASKDSRCSSTPRIMNDFLAGDFKFDDALSTTPMMNRRTSPRFMKSTLFSRQEFSTIKTENGAGKRDIEMTDASAA